MINLLQKSLDRRRIVKSGAAAGAAMAFNPFSRLVSAQEAADLPTDTSDMDALIAGAQKENKIVSYGMPDYWANLGEMWKTFMAKYNIAEHEDADLVRAGDRQVPGRGRRTRSPTSATSASSSHRPPSSSASARHSRTTPGTRSPTGRSTPMDSGPSSTTATSSSWSIPTSSIPCLTHSRICSSPTMPGQVSIERSRSAAQGNFTVFAAAFANGGDETNVQPGSTTSRSSSMRAISSRLLPIWRTSRRARRSSAFSGTIWPRLRDQARGSSQSGESRAGGRQHRRTLRLDHQRVRSTPLRGALDAQLHPLPRGATLYAKGYATPILPDIEIPADVAAKRPPAEAYDSVRTIKDWNQGFVAFQQIANDWGPTCSDSERGSRGTGGGD